MLPLRLYESALGQRLQERQLVFPDGWVSSPPRLPVRGKDPGGRGRENRESPSLAVAQRRGCGSSYTRRTFTEGSAHSREGLDVDLDKVLSDLV